MAVYVNTNVSSLNGRRYLNNVQNQLTTTYQRLSSGLRINSAKDDAAGLQISSRLTTQVNGLNQGNRNAADGIALAQTIEGAMDETTNMLQKIRTLAVQAANGTNTGEDKAALSKEATALVSEIDRIAGQTRFGGALILDGSKDTGLLQGGKESVGQLTLQVGANKGDTISFDIANAHFTRIAQASGKFGAAGGGGGGAKIDMTKFFNTGKILFSKADAANEAIAAMDAMIAQIDSERAGLGAIQNHGRAKHTQ